MPVFNNVDFIEKEKLDKRKKKYLLIPMIVWTFCSIRYFFHKNS